MCIKPFPVPTLTFSFGGPHSASSTWICNFDNNHPVEGLTWPLFNHSRDWPRAHSHHTTERNTSSQTAPSCSLFIHPTSFPITHTYTHTHTHIHTYTNLHTH